MDQLDELMARPPASTGLTTTTVDPLDTAMDGYVNGKQTQVKASLNVNVDTSPEEYARQKRIASILGSPVAAVQALPKDADRAAKIRQIENDTAQAPKLRDMYTDSDFTKLAHDDSGVLSRVEKAFTAFTSGISKGSIQDELGDLNYRAMIGNITPEQQARRTQLKGQMTKLDTQAQDDNSVLDYILNQTGYTGRQVVSSFREGGKGALAGASAGALAGGVAGAVLPPTELLTVPGAASLGARAGFVASSAVYNYKMEAGFAYDEFAEMMDVNGQPLPNDVAVGAAAAVGLINAGLETTGEMFMAKLFPGMDKLLASGGKEAVKAMLAKPTVRAALASAGKKWVTAASAEGITEALQELSTIFGREGAQAVSGQEFKPDDLGDDAKRVAQAGMDAFVGSMGVGAAPSGYHARQQVKQAQQQQRNAEFIQALGDDATESKLRERAPDKFSELVAKVKEDGPVQNIYIPAEQFQTFFQSQNIDPAEVAAQAGAANYTEALAAGTDVVIPVEKYAATLAGSQFHQGLAPDIRLHQGDMTAREFAEYQANQESIRKEIESRMDELVAEQEKQGGINQAIEEIVRDTEGQLIGAGTEASTAKAQATLMRGIAVLSQRETMAQAQREGREATPQEIHDNAMALWQRYGLTVSRPMPEVLGKNPQGDINIDPLLDALRAGAFPQDRDIFGAGLAEFIRNAGGIVPSGEANTAQENMERRPFQKNLVQKNGMSLDMALEKAVQAGYFPGREQGDLTEADFLDALDNDLRGGGVFSIHAADNNKLAMREAMNSLGDYLDSLGIDLSAVTDNAQVRKLMEAASQGQLSEAVREYAQSLQQGGDVTNTPAFIAWAHGHPVIRMGESHEFADGEGVVVEALHGTTGDFDTFDQSKANIESDLGGGFYFTNNPADVSSNYAGEGPDLTQKIQLLAERIAGETDREYDDPQVIAEAKQQLSVEHGGMAMPVFVRFDNPVVIGGSRETFLDYKEPYDEETDEYGEPEGKLVKFVDALRDVASEYSDADADGAMADVWERVSDYEGINASELIKMLAESEGLQYATDDNGTLANKEIIRRAFEAIGYDGFIDQTVNEKFGSEKKVGKSMDGMNENTVHFIAFTQTQIKSRLGNNGEFSETDPNILHQDNGDKRGYIQFGADRKFNIGLLEKANLSTFLHETGHFYLEVLGDLAQAEGASDQVKADYAALLKWFGVESRDQIETKHHEMFARANEAYLMEGQAPSAELRSVFQRFKAWLTMIYREFSRLDVKLSNEVRGVFDRVYATDQEIEAAKHDVDVSPLFLDAATAGMTEQEFAAYVASVTAATQAGKEALQTKLMREYLRERQAWWKEELGKVREEVAAEVDAQPVYRAFDALVAGKVGDTPIKLNKDGLIEKYGSEYVKRLPRGFQRIYTTTGGMDADAAAAFLGFESGDKLVEALAGMRNRKELVEAEAQQRMRERHGDMLTDGTLADEARVALHNSQRENILMAELRALKRKQREVAPFVKAERDKAAADAKQAQKERAYERRWMDAERNTAEANRRAAASAATQVPPASAFRDAARGMIGQIKVRDLEPFRYLRAERTAAKQAFEAMAKGEYMLAANAKQRELFNHHLYLEAMKAREEADATLKYMRRFVSGTTRAQMGKAGADYLDQIDALLERYEFARVTNKKIDRRKSLLDFINEQEAAGNEPAIDVRLMDEARRVNYRDIPVDELRAVRDAVKNIEHLAGLKNRLLTKKGAVEFADAIAELKASAENNGQRTPLPLDQAAMTRMEKAGDKVSRLDAMLLKTEQIVEWLDGGNVNGAWHTYLWNPIAQAQTDEMDLTQELTAKIAQSLEQMPKEQRLSMLDTFDVPGMGKVTRKFIVSIAMNMGNQGNLDKMMRGFGWNMTTIEGALAKLNESDIRFVQQTLDTINSLWPKIAELEKRMTGLEPEKVDSHTFEVKGADGRVMGTISGYFPLVYDPRKSEAGAKQETGSLGQLFDEGYVRATTPKGHTKLRTEGFAAPLMLDFEQVITQHLAKVVKDLTHREAVVGINRILTNPEIRNVLQETLGPAYEKQMLPWLRSVVNDRNGGSTQGLADFSRWMMSARANVVAATMGFKATTAIAQITGLSQSLDKVSAKHLSQALLEFLRHPVALTREVRERSGEMRHRADTLDRDIRDQLRNLTGQNSTWAQAQKFAFHGIAIADAMVAVPTWMGAYRQAIEAGANEETALLEADAAVRLTQGSGGAKDLAAIQRNNELAKTLTMFYSYFSVLYNRLRDMGRDVQEIRDMPRFLARVFFTVMFPAVMSELILGRGPKDDEDGWLWAIKKVLLYPLMSVPVLRDVASSMDSGFDYKFSPIATGIEKVAKLTTATGKLIEGDVEWPDYAAKVAETIGYVFGVAGTAQLNATGKYLWRVSEGEEQPDNIAELIYYATVGKRKE